MDEKSQQTLFAEGSPVRTSVRPVSVLDWKENVADSGASMPALLASYDPASSSWKTSQRLLTGGFSEFSETLPISGMTRNGIAYQLPPLVPRILEKDSGLWPTPEASLDIAPYSPKTARNWGGNRPSGAKIGSSLRWFPEFLPDSDAGGKWVNPVLCQKMMGFPACWADLEPTETPLFRKYRKSLAKP